MADAPAAGGGNGWGVLEVILAIILAIGLISTLTGNSVQSFFGSPATKKSTAHPSSTLTSKDGCGIMVTQPKTKEKIYLAVPVKGVIEQCLTVATIPDIITGYVIDSKGTLLSAYTTITINKTYFGDANFSTVIPLQGAALSTTAYLVLNGPARNDGTMLSTRVQLYLQPSNAF